MQIIAILNQKGGVGKTTCAVNIAAGLTKLGKKVLLLDMDPQANLTYSLGFLAHELTHSVYNLLKKEITINNVLIECNGFKLIPSALMLSGAEQEFVSTPGREFLLKEALEDLNGFEYVFIDCPPSLGILSINCLTCANHVWIPLQTEFLPMQGIVTLMQTIETIKNRLNSKLEISGIICTRYDRRKRLHKEVVEKINEHFGSKVFKTIIRENVNLAEAPGFGKNIFDYKPKSYGAEDYLNLSKEFIEREKTNE